MRASGRSILLMQTIGGRPASELLEREAGLRQRGAEASTSNIAVDHRQRAHLAASRRAAVSTC
jgi:hypothetical protein